MCHKCNHVTNFYLFRQKGLFAFFHNIHFIQERARQFYKPCYCHGSFISTLDCKNEGIHQTWGYILYTCTVFCYLFQRESVCSVFSASNISNCWWCCCISAFKSIKDNLLLKLPGHIIFNKSQILFRDYNKKTLCLIINFIFILAKHPPLDSLPCFVKKNQHSGNEVLVLLCGHSKEYVEVM